MSTKPAFTAKTVTFDIGGTEFKFTPTVADANNYTNGVTLDNKVEPARTYLERTVDKDQKDALVELMNTVPGLAVELHQKVHEESKGGIKITLKN
ncbi:putative phage tail assembly chaperone [Vibrio plantisponsor]|uniref:putative phage tail assembly chaperone n=1 Tax=Vibrio plantisponsor TaxID=664643 RepID=UPI00370B49A2